MNSITTKESVYKYLGFIYIYLQKYVIQRQISQNNGCSLIYYNIMNYSDYPYKVVVVINEITIIYQLNESTRFATNF